ncbi:HAL/PAL/TAL family ammonia-lyase [Denitrobaculum tricleocarpae]|uniref:Aromatic amino acid lyase n=1 Tax=Denitrobaculum tricleocarpae TaxID=2591009 RepID=A0A545TF43_9PROT|nr:aromatic amino acid ammonia-lyase [Denitrobaculum tricleocarpae]TQV75801.1 aromatic amino acid lyase [Denitrobaculum tricleocarpae]
MILDGGTVTLEQVIAVAKGGEKVELSAQVAASLAETRALIDGAWMTDDAPLIYSFNTGVGAFKDRRIAVEDIKRFQTNLILAHATGLGEPLTIAQSRAVMFLRLNAFCSDHSGVTLPVAQRLIDFLNKGLSPVIPVQGSVGASGDLAPLAHMTGALCGFEEAEVIFESRRLSAREGLEAAGLSPELDMQSKDASALINGSTVSLAVAVLALAEAGEIARNADIGLALSLEAMRCETDAFIAPLHAARPHPGQQLVARNVSALVAGSKRMSEAARKTVFPEEARTEGCDPAPRVQDTYSLRCAPQVHGPAREALSYARTVIEREINSATDNPLIVDDGGQRRAVSGGHFHGQYVAQVMDLLAIAMTDLGSICERRIARLIDPNMSYGLPRNLASGIPGLNTGYGTVQCSLSALVMENRTLSTPGSVDSIPGKGNAEDHVSNSMWCARKASQVVENLRAIVAGEILVAAQALSQVAELAKGHEIAPATAAVVAAVRNEIPARLEGDIWFAKDMNAIIDLVCDGRVVAACESVIGRLE